MITRVWTQADLSEQAQLPKERIRELINDRARPSPPELETLALVLGLDDEVLRPGTELAPSDRVTARVPADRFVSVGAVSGLYRLALERVQELAGCTEGSEEEAEFARLAKVVAAYEKAVGMPEPARSSAAVDRPAPSPVCPAIDDSVQYPQGVPQPD
jgi:hypothetical protein